MNTIKIFSHTAGKRVLLCALALLLSALAILTLARPASAASYPKPEENIADDAGVLSDGTVRAIRNANEATAKDVGAIIAVCTVSTTGDTPIGDYARAIFNDWKLGDCVLVLITVDDMNYYFLQSTKIDSIITNNELSEISGRYLEEDFVAGNIDSGVMKVVSRLSSILSERLEKIEEPTETEPKATTFGSVVVGFFKTILIIALVAIVLFVALFVAAMFNDDIAELFRRYIFRRNKPQANVPVIHYDERLYGYQDRRPRQGQNGQRAPQPGRRAQRRDNRNGYPGGYPGGYPNDYFDYDRGGYDRDAYYDSNGQRRR